MKKKVFKNQIRKKIVSLMLASSMLVTSFGNGGADFTALAETTNDTEYDVDVSATVQEDYNSKIYDHLEDYPTGELSELSEEENKDVITDTEEYYEEVEIGNADIQDISYPSAVDLSQSEYAPNIVNQIGGSCALYSGVYYLGTYTINKVRGISSKTQGNTLSPLFVYNRTRGGESTGCGSHLYDTACFLRDNGAPYQSVAPSSQSVKNYEYTWYPTEEIWENAANNRIDKFEQMELVSRTETPISSPDDSDLDLMKAAINNGQMIHFATGFCTLNYTSTEGKSASHPGEVIVSRCDHYLAADDGSRDWGHHAMVIVGYDDNIWVDINHDDKKQDAEMGAIKIVNSHGTDYGQKGYVWVAYDALNAVSAVLNSADETRINAAIDKGTIVDGKISSKHRVPFLNGKCGDEVIYTCTSQKSTSDIFLVASVNTVDRVDFVLKINAKNKSTGKISSYDTEHDLKYCATDSSAWPTVFSLDGSTTGNEGTIAFDLNKVVSNISEDTLDDYEWSVSTYDRDSKSNPVTITKMDIKSQGMVLYTSRLSNMKLSGKATEYPLSESHTLLSNFDWNYAGDEGCVGRTCKLTASATTTDTLNYKFTVKDADGTTETLNDYSTTNYINWTPSEEGTYILTVYAKNSAGNVDIMKKKVTINPKMKLESFTIDKPSPQAIGETICATVDVTGGVGKKTCSIFAEFIRGSYYPETKVLDFSMKSDNSGTFTTHIEGTYRIYAVVKDETGYLQIYNYGEYTMEMPKIVSISEFDWDIDLDETTVGKSRTLTGTVMNNKGPVNYKYAVKDSNGTVTDICSYSTNCEVTWKPSKAGNYTLIMYAKDVDGTVAQKEKQIKVNERMTLESVTFDKTSPQKIGTKITATAKVKGGTGNKKCIIHVKGGNYQFGMKDLYFTMSNSTTGTWTPDTDGTYKVYVTVTDDAGYTTMLSGGSYMVNKEMSISEFDWDMDLDETTVGRSRTLTGTVANNIGTVNYKYTVKDSSGTVTELSSYSTTNKASWYPQKAGKYTLTMYAKDSDGTVVKQEKSVTVNAVPTLESITFDKVSPQKVGTKICATVKVKGGTGNKKCLVHVRGGNYENGSKQLYFTMDSNTTGTWTPDMDGTYNVSITVTDDAGFTTLLSGGKYVVNDELAISEFDWDIDLDETTVGRARTLTGTVANNIGTVNYKYTVKDSSGTVTELSSYSTTNKASWYPKQAGKYTLTMYAKDSDGTVVKQEKSVTVNTQPTVESITYDKVSPQKVGTQIRATVKTKGGTGNKKCLVHVRGGNYEYGSKELYFTMDSLASGTWTPDMDGTYRVYVTVTDDAGFTTLYSVEDYVVNKAIEETTFYYNNSKTNWSKVYAYVWSDGVSAKTYEGTKVATNVYQFSVPKKYTKVLFKNTSGTSSWDKQTDDVLIQNTDGYIFVPNGSSNKTSGSWNVYGGKTPEPTTPAPAPTTPVPVEEIEFYYNNEKTNWSKVYAYVWSDGVSATTYEGTKVATNVYQFKVPKKYAKVLFKNTSGTSNWDKQTDDVLIQNIDGYIFVPNGSSNKTSGSWNVFGGKTPEPTTPAPGPTTPAPAPTTPVPVEEIEFYYNNEKTNWSKVYAYVWADGVSAKTYEGTKVATNVYQFSVPKKYTKVLFKNTSGTSSWDKQTDDVLIQSTNGYIFVPNGSSNKTSGSWNVYGGKTPEPTTPAPGPTTPAPAPTTPVPIDQSYVTVDFDNSIHKWENVYAYVWNNTEDYKVFSPTFVSGNNHVLFTITGSYKYILFKNTEDGWDKQTADLVMPAYTTSVDDKCFTPYSSGNKSEGTWGKSSALTGRKIMVPSVSADKNTIAVGDSVNFTMTTQYESGNYKNSRYLTFTYEDGTKDVVRSSDTTYTIFEKVSEYTHKYTWTPSKTGKVKVTYSVSEYDDHVETSQPIILNVKAASNTVKVYYKNSSWSKAYVHYKVNGTWTSVPGVKMEASDRSGYTWMYTIDLGDTTSATLCFNNGNGSWDSKNGSNYTVGTGIYGISGNNTVKLN